MASTKAKNKVGSRRTDAQTDPVSPQPPLFGALMQTNSKSTVHSLPAPAATSRATNRVAARPHLKARSSYPTLSVVQLKPGPLTRLAWLFLGAGR